MTPYLLAAVLGYFLGAVPFAWLVAKLFAGVDIREVGSRNPGATNVYRSVGKFAGAAALALDAVKGVGAVVISSKLFGNSSADPSLVAALAGLSCIAGHTYTVFLKFKGGKGVATALGVFATLAPTAVAVGFAVFAIVYGLTRYVSAGSVAAAVIVPPVALLAGYPPATVAAASIAALVIIIRHRSNITRFAMKEEMKTPL
ncbi:MAG: glycerol-3-phosphate 1-O-acyltransferase PlsY [Endomicrobiia bacterium]|nr:glycerol-3-phosphate 1-O-acyltransferase PlsY [Endomicrobiia bacterium]